MLQKSGSHYQCLVNTSNTRGWGACRSPSPPPTLISLWLEKKIPQLTQLVVKKMQKLKMLTNNITFHADKDLKSKKCFWKK